jgi:hypothetical protein
MFCLFIIIVFLLHRMSVFAGIIPYSGTAWCVKQTIAEVFPTVIHRKQTTTELLISNAFAG